MPIDPNTGLITQNGTREEVYRAERDRARQMDYETQCSGSAGSYHGASSGSTGGLEMPASGAFRVFLTALVVLMVACILPSSWRWALPAWRQGKFIEVIVGFILVFMACMMIIAVITAIWQFFARGGLIKLAILAACGWLAWKVFIPHSIPAPNLAPIRAATPAVSAHPAHHPKP